LINRNIFTNIKPSQQYFEHPKGWKPLHIRMFEKYNDLLLQNTLEPFIQSTIDIQPIVEQSIKILNMHMQKPTAYIFSVGQSCSIFIFATVALSQILKIGSIEKFKTVAFSGKYYCNTCCLTGIHNACTISHELNDLFLPSKKQVEYFSKYIKEEGLLNHNEHFIIMDLVCFGAGMLSFINLFKAIHNPYCTCNYETYFFKKGSYDDAPMAQEIKKNGIEFLGDKEYQKHKHLFDMLSANDKDKNLRLVPEFTKHLWETVNPFEFVPHESAQKMLIGIIHYIQQNKISLENLVSKN
jgi:hypothetical protein